MEEIFESQIRSRGDLAGVFEFDGETAYFYLFDPNGSEGGKVLQAIHVLSETPDFEEEDVSVRWDFDEGTVGLFIRGTVWAAFDGEKRLSFGGNYSSSRRSSVPEEIVQRFLRGS